MINICGNALCRYLNSGIVGGKETFWTKEDGLPISFKLG